MTQPQTLLVVDIDGTLIMSKTKTIDGENRRVAYPVYEIIDAITPLFSQENVDIIFVTGRNDDEQTRTFTQEWLNQNFPTRPLFMRGPTDLTPAPFFKYSIVQKYRQDHHLHVAIIDDDPQICQYFQLMGHQVVRVDENNYVENMHDILFLKVPPLHQSNVDQEEALKKMIEKKSKMSS